MIRTPAKRKRQTACKQLFCWLKDQSPCTSADREVDLFQLRAETEAFFSKHFDTEINNNNDSQSQSCVVTVFRILFCHQFSGWRFLRSPPRLSKFFLWFKYLQLLRNKSRQKKFNLTSCGHFNDYFVGFFATTMDQFDGAVVGGVNNQKLLWADRRCHLPISRCLS